MMTGAASIQSSSAAPSAGTGAKQRVTAKQDGDQAEPDETSAFAEFVSYFESEESVLDVEATSAEDDSEPKDQKDGEDVTALQIEMIHHAWFGGEKSVGATEDTARRSAFVILKADPGSPDFEMNNAGSSMPPLAMSDWIGAAERENGNLLYRLAPQDPPSGRWGAKAQQNEQATAIHPLEIAETLAKVELPPNQAPKSGTHTENPVPRTENAASSAQNPGANSTAKNGEPVAANIKASLSALEAMLARDNSGPASDQMPGEDKSGLARQVIKEANISSIRQETHHSFGWSQSPVLQIAQRVTHEMQIARNHAMGQPDPAAAPEKAPVRVLHIQLDPPQLGPLTIRISLQNELLNLQLETPNPETAKLIHNDKDSLSKLLRSAGYMVEGLNIQVSPVERGSGGQPSGLGGGFGQAAGQQPGWRQPEGQPADDGWRGSRQGEASPQAGRETQGPQAGKPRGGAVYL